MNTKTTTRSYLDWIGRDAYDRNGDKIGEIAEVYYDDATERPEWLANIDRATDGPDITENTYEVTTHEEPPVVSKETVPKERVRLETETVTDEEAVGADLRKERIDVDDDVDR